MGVKLGELFKGDRKIKIYIIIAALLVLLIIFGGSLQKSNKGEPNASNTDEQSLLEYKTSLQAEVKSLLEKIEGVSEVSVMITLKSDAEYVYAKEERQTTDKTQTGYDDKEVELSDNYENNTIIVEGEDGRKTALVRTRLEPKVKGVLVVCKGASDPTVEQKVTNAVKTVLSIGANNVCVVS